jgi:hypothetical protein
MLSIPMIRNALRVVSPDWDESSNRFARGLDRPLRGHHRLQDLLVMGQCLLRLLEGAIVFSIVVKR